MSDKPYAQLTLADHEQNGFLAVAIFTGFETEDEVRAWVRAFEPLAVSRIDDSPYDFLLDAYTDPDNRVDEICVIPMQIARRLAGTAVEAVLAGRPDPDSRIGRCYAIGPAPSLSEFGLEPTTDGATR